MEFWFSELHTGNVKLSIKIEKQLFSGGKSWERLGRNWTRPRQNGQRRNRRGLQKRQSGEPVQKHGSMSTTRYTRSSMKMWVWKEPINPSWPQRPEPGN